MDQAKDPALLSFQTQLTKRLILGSYWTVIVLALPLWWYTTSIQRLSLPSSRVLAQADRELRFPINLRLDPSLTAQDPSLVSKLADFFENTRSRGLDIQINAPNDVQADKSTAYEVVAGHDRLTTVQRTLQVPQEHVSTLPDTLYSLIFPDSILSNPHVMQYAPRYRLSFTLMNEDAADGPAIFGWDIRTAISRHIQPVLSSLSVLHNFTIESQVQYHGPLAFQPRTLDHATFGLTQEDLTVFVNSAEWTLSSSISEDPVLHFLLYVPAASHRPLRILDKHDLPTSSKGFVLPQWGTIFVYNAPPTLATDSELPSGDLDQVFATFSSHLQTLLGVPRLPINVHHAGSSTLSLWQQDALLRFRALENAREAKDTLRSTVNLVNQIENMPVDEVVRGDVQDALDALELMHSARSLTSTLKNSARAVTKASRAFFYPGMLAMLYFPPEHTYAIYSPLFASAGVPLVAAVIREVLASRRRQRET